jgi:hypothetical protein
VAQVAECLLCKFKALSSNPSTTIKEKKKKGNKSHFILLSIKTYLFNNLNNLVK